VRHEALAAAKAGNAAKANNRLAKLTNMLTQLQSALGAYSDDQ
jgi:hypothetical protein